MGFGLSEFFPTRGCWNGFYGIIETGIFIRFNDICSQLNPSVQLFMFIFMLSCIIAITLDICSMRCMYFLPICCMGFGLSEFYQPGVVEMVFKAL